MLGAGTVAARVWVGAGGEMAAAELRGAVKVPTRLEWELMPLEGVGPLCFGMRITEVAAVLLPGMAELRRFQADPFRDTL